MDRNLLIDSIVNKIKQLPEAKIIEVSNFADFLLSKIDDGILQDGIQKITSESKAFEYLLVEEDIYSVNDLKEKYN
ncbi:MAG: hypothetical protein A2W90_22935 [Bacteroidetes bacterium GWF2_42_66]|nr:MAG: hypothetical protein A2W92_02745 [Bacteroidetes bacterium GWA2_42_15]OFX99465.1 MAG: hypothetical protein A2W89_12620 [Bacteroidetes bacterium GWE2_42_39]OFY46996.1 MAG: hypothetical protein A2W90_22935 [Bacteroidetes bacterium GWF2_42_66]HBL76849.1 hypothetical protein [Prolixibacteraceae bacterium]HCR90484.1 hypothetical protein [Prolixibacteraceae bacterium]